jgi:hypothetical protein
MGAEPITPPPVAVAVLEVVEEPPEMGAEPIRPPPVAVVVDWWPGDTFWMPDREITKPPALPIVQRMPVIREEHRNGPSVTELPYATVVWLSGPLAMHAKLEEQIVSLPSGARVTE